MHGSGPGILPPDSMVQPHDGKGITIGGSLDVGSREYFMQTVPHCRGQDRCSGGRGGEPHWQAVSVRDAESEKEVDVFSKSA